MLFLPHSRSEQGRCRQLLQQLRNALMGFVNALCQDCIFGCHGRQLKTQVGIFPAQRLRQRGKLFDFI